MPEPLLSNTTTPVTPVAKSADDVLSFLKTDDVKETPVKEPVTPETDESDKDEEKPLTAKEVKDDEIELKGVDDTDDEDAEKLDLSDDEESKKSDDIDEVITPPRKKDIVAKYPKFFQDFPFMEKLMFRDRQYTELFGSFDDAKEIAGRAQNLQEFETDLLSGDTTKVLASVKQANPKAFDKIVDGYLDTLAKVDKEAYLDVVSNIGKYFIKSMASQARADSNEDLQKAALLLNQYLFGSNNYTPPKQRVSETEDAGKKAIEDERRAYIAERFNTSRNELQSKIDNTLKSTIAEYIDPKGEMSPYVKKNAIKDALQNIHSVIGQDTAFSRNLTRLWEAAYADKFSQNSLRKIQSIYLGRSKQNLGAVIRKARAEALKDAVPSSRKGEEKEDSDSETTRKSHPTPGRPRQSSGKEDNKPRKGESVLEFLSR